MVAANPLAAVRATRKTGKTFGNQTAQDCSSSLDDVYHNVEKYLDYTVIETGEKL